MLLRPNENSEQRQAVNSLSAGKQVWKSGVWFLVLYLIGWEGGASFSTDQSSKKWKSDAIQDYFWQ